MTPNNVHLGLKGNKREKERENESQGKILYEQSDQAERHCMTTQGWKTATS